MVINSFFRNFINLFRSMTTFLTHDMLGSSWCVPRAVYRKWPTVLWKIHDHWQRNINNCLDKTSLANLTVSSTCTVSLFQMYIGHPKFGSEISCIIDDVCCLVVFVPWWLRYEHAQKRERFKTCIRYIINVSLHVSVSIIPPRSALVY